VIKFTGLDFWGSSPEVSGAKFNLNKTELCRAWTGCVCVCVCEREREREREREKRIQKES
jgi:hypothetical protein